MKKVIILIISYALYNYFIGLIIPKINKIIGLQNYNTQILFILFTTGFIILLYKMQSIIDKKHKINNKGENKMDKQTYAQLDRIEMKLDQLMEAIGEWEQNEEQQEEEPKYKEKP